MKATQIFKTLKKIHEYCKYYENSNFKTIITLYFFHPVVFSSSSVLKYRLCEALKEAKIKAI